MTIPGDVVGKKNAQVSKTIYSPCALDDVAFTDLYARKKSRNIQMWNYSILKIIP
jgi:hypothetical protein